VLYRRERIETPDGDFLDLDWADKGHDKVAILSHGLEGSSRGQYVRGQVNSLNQAGWDCVAWNCRGCSGEINRQKRLYHSGSSDDLGTVVEHVRKVRPGAPLALIGYSLGGNMTLKYLGEQGEAAAHVIRGAVAFSVPCDLASSSKVLARLSNSLYMIRFMVALRDKVRVKERMFTGQAKGFSLWRIRTFKAFDDAYTAPIHGFSSAEDYWMRASSKPFLPMIRVPTLLVQAQDDPFLAPPCYPYQEAQDSRWLHLEVPRYGGHGGFVSNPYYSDRRAAEFLSSIPPSRSGIR
ncbi:MAG TPA: alpha/beta fold hydrolase, partial [Candidatus Xenobia bacterium]|jgi:hypothetical protein